MLDLLFEYVDLSMTTLCPEKGKMEELEAYYQVKTLSNHIISALWFFCKKSIKSLVIVALSCNLLCMILSISSKVNIFLWNLLLSVVNFAKTHFYLQFDNLFILFHRTLFQYVSTTVYIWVERKCFIEI